MSPATCHLSQKRNRPHPDESAARAVFGKTLLLLFLGGLEGGLCGLRLGGALLELVHAAGGIHKLLLARVEGMAGVADAHDEHGLGGTGLDHVAAGAADFRIHIFRMNVSFHKRAQTIAGVSRLTRGNLRGNGVKSGIHQNIFFTAGGIS